MVARLPAIIALTLTTVIWGVAGPIIKLTLPYLPPFTFLFFRFLLASFIFLPFFLREEKAKPLREKDWGHLLLIGLFGMTLNLGLIFLGFERTSAIEGTLISATTPLFISLAGIWFLSEKINSWEKLGAALALAGTLGIVFEPLLKDEYFNHNLSFQHTEGNLLILLSNFAWVAYTILSKKLANKYSLVTLTFSSLLVGLISFLPLTLAEVFFYNRVPVINLTSLMGLAYMTFLSLGLAYFLYEWGLRGVAAAEAGVFAYLQPLFAIPAAYLLLGETVAPALWLPIALVALGVVIATASSFGRLPPHLHLLQFRSFHPKTNQPQDHRTTAPQSARRPRRVKPLR